MTAQFGPTGPDPCRATTPAALVAELNRLRAWAGEPSLRQLHRLASRGAAAGLTGDRETDEPTVERLPTSTTHEILAGRRLPKLPRLEFVEAFVAACLLAGGFDSEQAPAEVERWRGAWRALAEPATCHRSGDEDAQPVAVPAAIAAPGRLPAAPGRRSLAVLAAVFVLGAGAGVVATRLYDRVTAPEWPASAVGGAASPTSRCVDAAVPAPSGSPLVGAGQVADAGRWRATGTGVAMTSDGGRLRVTVAGGRPNVWDEMLIRGGLRLVNGRRYALSFEATADASVTIRVTVQDSIPPEYRPALVEDVAVGRAGCRRGFRFVGNTDTDRGELTFQLGGQGDFTLDLVDVVLVDQTPAG